MKKFFKENWPALIIFVTFFVIPSFWFDKGKVDYGGDSNRFYFYDPFSWLKNIALYLPNSLTSLGGDTANFMMIPFLLLLSLLRKLFFYTGYSLNNFFNGLILSGGFLSVYFIVKEFLKDEEGEKREKIFPAIIAGLFFVLSPILSMQWERSLYSISGIFVYPLVFLLFLKFIHTRKYYFLTLIAIICFVFSVNFSFATMPWFFAFFPLSFVFLFIYSLIKKKTKVFLKGGLVLFFLLKINIKKTAFPTKNTLLAIRLNGSRVIL